MKITKDVTTDFGRSYVEFSDGSVMYLGVGRGAFPHVLVMPDGTKWAVHGEPRPGFERLISGETRGFKMIPLERYERMNETMWSLFGFEGDHFIARTCIDEEFEPAPSPSDTPAAYHPFTAESERFELIANSQPTGEWTDEIDAAFAASGAE